jgi:two-component system response regulator AtoC
VFWGEQTETFALPPEGSVCLGRDEDNDVRIDAPSVSRRHAVLHLGKTIRIEDLGGSNGTCVREVKNPGDPRQTQGVRRLVNDSAELAIGECVLLGTACVVVRHARELVARFPDPEVLGAVAARAGEAVICDPAMRAIYAEADRAARATISVLLLGETGVGKEVLARAIHSRSRRADGPFIGVNCAAFSESILEGELFGYERGAFTGARDARPGLFEAADGGTVFLDEVAEASPATQAKLLRVVEERSVMRLGSRRPRKVDVRIVSATNREPEVEISAGRFRQDLYFRLAGVVLAIPPLRARPLDLEPLAVAFAASACRQLERPNVTLSPETLACLARYPFPGNVRELCNVIERAVILSGEDCIRPEHLPPAVRTEAPPHPASPTREASNEAAVELDVSRFRADVKALDRERIREALERASGNQTRAAELLGISRRTLVSRLQEFDLPRPRKRGDPQK